MIRSVIFSRSPDKNWTNLYLKLHYFQMPALQAVGFSYSEQERHRRKQPSVFSIKQVCHTPCDVFDINSICIMPVKRSKVITKEPTKGCSRPLSKKYPVCGLNLKPKQIMLSCALMCCWAQWTPRAEHYTPNNNIILTGTDQRPVCKSSFKRLDVIKLKAEAHSQPWRIMFKASFNIVTPTIAVHSGVGLWSLHGGLTWTQQLCWWA